MAACDYNNDAHRLLVDSTAKEMTLKEIIDEYGKSLDAETKKEIFARQKRRIDKELRRLGKVRRNILKNQQKSLFE